MDLVSLVVSNDKSQNVMGERRIRKMVDEIITDLQREDFESKIEEFEDEDNWDGDMDWLNDL